MGTVSSPQDTQASRASIADTPTHPCAHLTVIKRDGRTVQFEEDRIRRAILAAYLDVKGLELAGAESINEMVQSVMQRALAEIENHTAQRNVTTVHIEHIQDKVESALAYLDQHDVYREYVIYRERHREAREKAAPKENVSGLTITTATGETAPLDETALKRILEEACSGLEATDPAPIFEDTLKSLFNGIHILDVRKALIMTARTYIEKEPNYAFVTARLLMYSAWHETLPYLGFTPPTSFRGMRALYASAFMKGIEKGIQVGLLNPKFKEFDLKKLSKAIDPKRDFAFTYLGIQTLYDRYFLHQDDTRIELPQCFFMRVAMGLALEEDNKTDKAIEFYKQYAAFTFMSSTPTLFNSGTTFSQLSSCFLSTVSDDLWSIYGAIRDNAMLSKFAGGLGVDWTQIRAMGAHIKGTNGKSQGVVPFLKVFNDTLIAVNQGGKRKGAGCAYLESWHLDIEEFLELRKNTGDDRRRTHDMNTANWIPDLFMKRLIAEENWTLFSPDEVPELHDLFGEAFEKAYTEYEEKAHKGKIKRFKVIPAKSLWRKMLSMLFETGHPWITFKDPCNLRSPQQHTGTVHSSNLCTEITLNTSDEEIAVCNLGSVNLAAHIENGKLNQKKLRTTVRTAIRMLDNVIDLNYYSVSQAKNSNMKHRPIGMGIMGFQDALYQLGLSYASDEAVEFADRAMEQISYYAIEASSDLAAERGVYESYAGSLWSQGILPIDSIALLAQTRTSEQLNQNQDHTLNWDVLRAKIQKQGMRNSNVLAIAPTATIGNITGVTASIEPTFQNLFVKSNLSGEFTTVNPYLVTALKEAGLWDKAMLNDLKYYNGSIQKIKRIPDHIKSIFMTAFEVDPMWLIKAGSRRMKWIDQSQSLNLYFAQPSGKKLDEVYRAAWQMGLKTTYYCRTLGATDPEKSTINRSTLNAVQTTSDNGPMQCAIDDPSCEACQ